MKTGNNFEQGDIEKDIERKADRHTGIKTDRRTETDRQTDIETKRPMEKVQNIIQRGSRLRGLQKQTDRQKDGLIERVKDK